MSGLLVFPPMLSNAGGGLVAEPAALVVYQADFPLGGVYSTIRSQAIKVRRDPHVARPDREHTYWHMITDGPDEVRRTLDLARVIRLPWALPLLRGHLHEKVKRWWNMRAGLQHICVWHPAVNYLLVLKQRHDGLYLLTSYCPEPKRKLQFHHEWAEAKKAGRTF